ncbi:glucan endo-1,3-beta-glucosidase 7 isoform X2 [Impatiens glandulifera]|uniref:glucan endo-1,3-beta-glucosidase 7 isoform X2 n=1 Tax=Impatiens glandulifera TaxID=253017 RepID=UPI001FB04CA5|nr:glucan endo-1,3-beta-glucosidase 7 isoform X2 [Impatiens glandulifera]
MSQPFFFFHLSFFLFFSICFSYEEEMLNLTKRDIIYPPIDNYPASPVTFPPDTDPTTTIPTPTIVNVPSTNPIIDQPPTIPVNVPSTTLPPLTPIITNPVTSPGAVPGAQPVTNPVTTYPIPSTGVPVTTPVTTPSGMLAGQSWCVAKSDVTEAALQSAIDYACGIGGADCSAIQQGASCYNPNTLQYHASYAFNSYYQKNPFLTSCDFGGTAITTSANPSTGTCVFPAASSSSSSISSPAMGTPTTSSSTTTTTTTGVASPSFISSTVSTALLFILLLQW